MTEADATLDFDEMLGGLASPSDGQLPRDTEFAERIIRRLNPVNQQQMFDLAARQSKIGGMLITLMVVVWWLFIGVDQDDMGAGVSVFFGLDFGQAALAVMGLSLGSAVLTEFSRDMGKILPSTLAGGMLILAGLYVAEPLVSALFLSSFDLTFSESLWRSARLGVLWAGMSFGAYQIVNAMLLNWLIRFMNSNGYDYSGIGDASQEMDARLLPGQD
jgi:hypothetical protein